MALKEFQRKTTFELGLRNSDRPSHSPNKSNKIAQQPIVHRRMNTDLNEYESASSFGNQTLGAQLYNDS